MDTSAALGGIVLLAAACGGSYVVVQQLCGSKAKAGVIKAKTSKKKSKKKRSKSKKKKADKVPEVDNTPKKQKAKTAKPETDQPAADTSKDSGKLSRNQRRKRNARARQEAKERGENQKKLDEKLNGGASAKPAKAAQQKKKDNGPKNDKEKARKRWEEYQKDLADGWEVVGADKIKMPDKVSKKRAKKKAAAAAKAAETKAGASEPTGPVKTTAKLEVEPKHYGKIIGTGGATLKAIMEKSGAVIRMPRRDAEVPSKTIMLEGTGEQIGVAKSAIHELINKGYSRLLNPEIAEGAISIDPKLHGLIIGPKGSVINALKQKTGVSINFPNPASESRRIQLSGTKNGIKAAKAAIKFISQYRYSPLVNPNLTHREIPVPAEKMGLVIGPKASTRRHIEGNTKAKIHCPSRGDEKQNIIVVGTKDAVELAQKHILKILRKDETKDDMPGANEEPFYEEEEDDQPTDDLAAQYLIDRTVVPEPVETAPKQSWVEPSGAPAADDAADWE